MAGHFEIAELLDDAGWLRSLAASLIGDGTQADDLVQDTWLAALRRPPRSAAEPRPWLARVARNLARNTRRDRSRRAAREELAHEERALPGPDTLAQEAEAQRLLADAVTRLAEPLRDAIVLRYFQGLDSSAAAARLGVPASTVRTRLQKALEELRADLDRRFEGRRQGWGLLLAPLVRGVQDAASHAPAPAAAGVASLGSWVPALVASAGAVCVRRLPARSLGASGALRRTCSRLVRTWSRTRARRHRSLRRTNASRSTRSRRARRPLSPSRPSPRARPRPRSPMERRSRERSWSTVVRRSGRSSSRSSRTSRPWRPATTRRAAACGVTC